MLLLSTSFCSNNFAQLLFLSGQNQSRLTCQYRHYADGVCKKTTCFSRSCPDFYQCEWQSECMDAYLASSKTHFRLLLANFVFKIIFYLTLLSFRFISKKQHIVVSMSCHGIDVGKKCTSRCRVKNIFRFFILKCFIC